MEPVLQIALDFVDLDKAEKIAKESVAGGVDWLEAGTPLIKSEGLDSVRQLRKLFPNHKIVADMKVMDTGRVEVEAAARAGANIVTVLAAADNSTISEAIDAAKNIGCEIMVDLIGAKDPAARAKEVEALGADYVCMHLSIDMQMKGLDVLSNLQRVANAIKIPVAAAGGLTSETAPKAIKAGANIIIVGGSITKSDNVAKAVKEIKSSMKTGKSGKSTLSKKTTDPLAAFSKVSAANVSDAMHRSGEMKGIRSITGEKVCGRAVTVRTSAGDWEKPVEAIDLAGPGDVIVIDAGGSDVAVWGELATNSCITRKVEGVVIDGASRDNGDVKKLKFPLFARHETPTAGEPRGFGEINVTIKCGGLTVRPGDYIIGDEDGVVVVPKEKAVEVANRALDVLEKENKTRGEIKKGSTLAQTAQIKKWCCNK
jgi:3-hexulose-6-phosphate synthase / 6-phospho-3-hexuloisomerase